ncbi:MAG TPA: hypothetical protein VFS21_17980 [Roseiflexaceae bacterium]|nr:hypothetical protein [Roseiflexaceae bacterium]
MPEEVRATRTRAPTAEEEAQHQWFEEQQRDPTRNIEDAARQIIQVVSAFFAVIFAVLALAGNPRPDYLSDPLVRGAGAVIVVCELLALLFALVVVVPSAYRYAPASQTQRQTVYAEMLRRKVWALRLALGLFAVGSVAFAALFIMLLFR